MTFIYAITHTEFEFVINLIHSESNDKMKFGVG